jgi:hypothetical protein
MALRTFRAQDGTRWTVWLTRTDSAGRISGTPSEWLAFQNENATERRRLFDFPVAWSELPEDRLDLLRRIAEPVILFAQRHSPPQGTAQPDEMADATAHAAADPTPDDPAS